ncbi:MAG: 30S ribosomal protein S16 [Dehalococcoidia bacterium]|nr:30S ribosomal protein S16 [Dehalococcoidia bacterium]
MLKIRLRRTGKTKKPYYRVVVAQNEKKRDGAFLETLGSYDPHANPPSVQLDEAKTREWMAKGAQPSEAAEKVLRRAGVLSGAPSSAASAAPAPKAEAKPAEAAAPAAEVVAEAPADEPAAAAEEAATADEA